MGQKSHQIWKQTVLIVIIVSRWVLPKGGLSHDELSNLLFVYFAIASDIMELSIFEIFDRLKMCDVSYGIVYAILAVWSASLLQFTFPLSAKKQKKTFARKRRDKICGWFYETEIWSLLLTVLLQDGPFLAVRIYCLINYELYSYEIIFFTSKNALIILLQLYRVGAVLYTRVHSTKTRKKAERLAPMVISTAATTTVAQSRAFDTFPKPSPKPSFNESGYSNGGYVNGRESSASTVTDIIDIDDPVIINKL